MTILTFPSRDPELPFEVEAFAVEAFAVEVFAVEAFTGDVFWVFWVKSLSLSLSVSLKTILLDFFYAILMTVKTCFRRLRIFY